MSLETFRRQLEIWQRRSIDDPESSQFQDLVKFFKLNKDKKGLSTYVGEHILTTLNTADKHKIKKVIVFGDKVRKNEARNLEELVSDYIR